jgi:hypothetical protein
MHSKNNQENNEHATSDNESEASFVLLSDSDDSPQSLGDEEIFEDEQKLSIIQLELLNKNEELNKELSQSKENDAKLRLEMLELQEKIKKLETKLAEQNAKHKNNISVLTHVSNKESTDLKEQNDNLIKQNKEYYTKLEVVKNEKAKLEEQIRISTENQSSTYKQNLSLSIANTVSKKQADDYLQLIGVKNKDIDELKNENKLSKILLKNNFTLLEAREKELKNQQDNSQEIVQSLQTSLDEQDKKIKALEKEITKKDDQLTKIATKLSEADEKTFNYFQAALESSEAELKQEASTSLGSISISARSQNFQL